MSERHRAYEAECERIRTANADLLESFRAWLAGKGRSAGTIRERLSHIDLYLNHYLLYEDAIEAPDGAYRVGMFLGYWLVRKVLGVSEYMIRGSAASLKQFYGFMNEKGLVSDEALEFVREQIRTGTPEGLAKVRRYR
jgi:hypothetical protein